MGSISTVQEIVVVGETPNLAARLQGILSGRWRPYWSANVSLTACNLDRSVYSCP
jgi:hypothetical protein